MKIGFSGDKEFIFDLKNDISEENNLIDISKNIYDEYKFKFKEWDDLSGASGELGSNTPP